MSDWIFYVLLFCAVYSLRVLSENSSKFRFIVRISLFIVAVTVASGISILSALFFYPLGKGIWLNRVMGGSMCILGPLMTGVSGEIVEGDKYLEYVKGSPKVFVINHQSTLDLLLLGYVSSERAVLTAKMEVGRIPFMGWVFTAGSNILIDRGNRDNAIQAMNKVKERMMKDDLSVVIFPEGTRSHQTDNSLLSFKKGAFHLAKQGGFPIVPIVASTYFPIYDERTMKFESGTFEIKILPPIQIVDLTVEELVEKTHSVMGEALQSIKSKMKGC